VNVARRGHITFRRIFTVLATFALVVGGLTVVAPAADAGRNSCWAKNLTKDTPARTNLQRVITKASSGDRIAVKNVCDGNFRIAKRLTLVGRATPGRAKAGLNANGVGRVLRVSGGTVRLSNLKVTGGAGTCTDRVDFVGGGIYVSGSRFAKDGTLIRNGILTLKDVVVRGNTACYGGGIYLADGLSESGSVTLKGVSSIRANKAFAGGGGIYSDWGPITLNGSSSVNRNFAAGGGGIYMMEAATLTMNDTSTVSKNVARSGGGIYLTCRCELFPGPVTLNDSARVSGNVARRGPGGGIYSDGGVEMNDTSSVSRNAAAYGGGGIYTLYGWLAVNNHAVVLGNTARRGGGVYAGEADVRLYGSGKVRGNTARRRGGGMYVAGEDYGSVVMNGSASVSGNEAASYGGGMFVREQEVTLNGSSSIKNNSAESGGGIYNELGTVILNDLASVIGNMPDDCVGC